MIERTVILPAPPAEVWTAVTDASWLSEWFGAEVRGEPGTGARLDFRWPDGSERAATIEALEPGALFAFRWAPFARVSSGGAIPIAQTRVTFTLVEHPEGTQLHVIEDGVALARASGGGR